MQTTFTTDRTAAKSHKQLNGISQARKVRKAYPEKDVRLSFAADRDGYLLAVYNGEQIQEYVQKVTA